MTNTSLTVTAPRDDAAPNTHTGLDHAVKATELQRDRTARAMCSAFATAQVFALGFELENWQELIQMQRAAWQRLLALQGGWMQDWTRWVHYSEQIRAANTMSKFAEREGNIFAQFIWLVHSEATDLVGLQENIEVDYSYWINARLGEKRKPPAVAPE